MNQHPSIGSFGTPETNRSDPRAIFVLGRFSSEGSGLERAACDLANALSRIGMTIPVYTTVCPGQHIAEHMLQPPNQWMTSPGRWWGGLSHSPALRRRLREDIAAVDVVHNHTVWMLPNHYASQAAHRAGKPVLFTPHGTLDPFALRMSRWKKRLVAAWFQDRDFHRAACLHVFTRREVDAIRAYGLRNPIAIVPNGVDLDAFSSLPDRSALENAFPEIAGKRICLFLSRLHYKKGLVHLIQAWQRLAPEFDQWHLVVAGPDYGQETEIRRRIRQLHVEHCVTLTGALFGARKLEALAAAHVFVLPSFSEGFSMAVLEAMACRLPVLITPGCNFSAAIEAGAGIEALPNVDDTERGLRSLMAMPQAELTRMGARGRALIESQYTWRTVAEQMRLLYQWLAGGGSPPPFVHTS